MDCNSQHCIIISRQTKICGNCGGFATREAVFLVQSNIPVVERYCEPYSRAVVKESKKEYSLSIAESSHMCSLVMVSEIVASTPCILLIFMEITSFSFSSVSAETLTIRSYLPSVLWTTDTFGIFDISPMILLSNGK